MVLAAEPPETSTARPMRARSRLGARGIDQGHRALGEAFFGEQSVVGLGHDIDDRIADPDDIERPHPLTPPRMAAACAAAAGL